MFVELLPETLAYYLTQQGQESATSNGPKMRSICVVSALLPSALAAAVAAGDWRTKVAV